MSLTRKPLFSFRSFGTLFRQVQWSYLPPILVYLAAGLSGLTNIVGVFFVKEYLDLSAAFLASLAFWAGIPWALKMPVGHLVDIFWSWKSWIIYLGGGCVTLSFLIMYGLISHTEFMNTQMSLGAWFVFSALLAPVGYVLQDAVADAMTVEAIPPLNEDGHPFSDIELKEMHTTMQTLGRFAIISGLVIVSLLNIFMFADVETLTDSGKAEVYENLYLMALAIPFVSVIGVLMNAVIQRNRATRFRNIGMDEAEIEKITRQREQTTEPNWWILGGTLVFVVFTVGTGLSGIPLSQEIVFVGSMAIVIFLIMHLLQRLDPQQARALIGTATIIFVFRAVPGVGPGVTWFEIDQLGFDQRFISILSLVTACLALFGMVILRPLMASKSIAYIIVLLTLFAGLLSLPNIGLYYGLHHWTSDLTGGVVDARFIAIIDAAIESPLGQVAMIPMLAWIARNAPDDLKATFFAVMASFTNLALSASSLGTKYLNQIFVVQRQVKDPISGQLITNADYSPLGLLLITTALIGICLPLLTVFIIQRSPLKTHE